MNDKAAAVANLARPTFSVREIRPIDCGAIIRVENACQAAAKSSETKVENLKSEFRGRKHKNAKMKINPEWCRDVEALMRITLSGIKGSRSWAKIESSNYCQT